MALSSQTKKTKNKNSTSSMPETLCFVVNQDGYIINASPLFADILNIKDNDFAGQMLTNIIAFTDPDEALRTQALFATNANDIFADMVYEGVHEIRSENDPECVALIRFDVIQAKDGKKYIIGSKAEDENDTAIAPQFANQILKIINPPEEEKSSRNPLKRILKKPAATNDVKTFLDMSSNIMIVTNHDGTIINANTQFSKILGFDHEMVKSLNFIDIVHPADRTLARNCLVGAVRNESGIEELIDFETRIVGKDGSIHWIEWRQKSEDGSIYAVGHDVTAIKQQESALKKQRKQLEEAQAIGHMGHWRWAVGADDLDWSDEIYRIFGVEPGSFEPTLDNVNGMLHKRDIGRLLQAFQRAIIEENNYDMEFRISRPSGELRFIRCEGKCERDQNGEVIALFGIMQDMTERILHERALQEAKEAAESAYASKSQFLANMSHELRTPLNAIIGFSEMMQRQLLGPLGNEKYIDYITGIRESGEHLLDLINDILDMSKIEAGKYELDLEELNVAKVVKLAIHMMEGRAQDSQITITTNMLNENLNIIADRRALMQIVLNILSNAVKFSETGGKVHIECIERDEFLSIKVHDDGIGIPAHKIHCITSPFEQAASHYTRDHEGTGLGLTITKDLIDLHGGSLHIDSVVDQGTTVTIRMPYDAYKQIKNSESLNDYEEEDNLDEEFILEDDEDQMVLIAQS